MSVLCVRFCVSIILNVNIYLQCSTGMDASVADRSEEIYCSSFQQIIDINECANNNGGCSDHCNNIPASYSCACRQYADLDSDGKHCTCRPGFTQNDISVTCDGKGGGASVSGAAMLCAALVL